MITFSPDAKPLGVFRGKVTNGNRRNRTSNPMSRRRRVLVLNHFAVPRGEPGGTRHVEMFSRLRGWSYLILASRYNLKSGRVQHGAPGFRPVWVSPHTGNGITRVASWCTYFVSAIIASWRYSRPAPNLIYASSPHLLTGLAGYLLACFYRRPFVLEVRDLWPQILVDMQRISDRSFIYRTLSRLERLLYRKAHAIVTMAPGTSAHISKQGIPSQKIHYIPNGADPADYAPTASRASLRQRYGFKAFTAVYIGAHGPANGLQALLNAAEQIKDDTIELVLVGDGPDKERLLAHAREHRLDNVRFLDPVPKSEVPDLLHAADLGLHVLADVPLFRNAVSPNKLFDYMAAGLPVITNSPGIVEDWVQQASNGWYASSDKIADTIKGAAQTSLEDLRLLGLSGQDWLTKHQSRSAMSDRLQLLLDRLASADRTHGR